MISRKSIALAAVLAVSGLVGCDSMNHKDPSSDKSCCADEMIAKGNAMKADAMKMEAGSKRDEMMTKANHMIQEGQECKEKAAKM